MTWMILGYHHDLGNPQLGCFIHVDSSRKKTWLRQSYFKLTEANYGSPYWITTAPRR